MADESDVLVNIGRMSRRITKLWKKDPEGVFVAFCLVIFEAVIDEYREFVKDLDLEEEDKAKILAGMAERKVSGWLEDIYELEEFDKKVLEKYEKEKITSE